MASHPLRRQIRYRYFGLDPHPRAPRPLPTSRHGPRPLQADLQNLASLRPDTWRSHIEVVAMAGFTGIKSAAAEELPGARAVMDPFHVVHLAGNALDECRRRILQELHHRRGRATDPYTRTAGCYTPDLASSRCASSTNYSTCFPATSTSPSRSPGAPIRTSLMPTAHPKRARVWH